MKRIEIQASTREELGKNRIKKLRKDNKVPAVMYGDKSHTLSISSIDALKIYKARHDNFIIKMILDGKNEKEALLKDIQLDSVKNSVIHMDFLELIAGKTITTKIHVELEGDPEGVKLGGIIEHFLWEVHIECLPKDIPEHIKADISNFQIGDSLHISDLKFGEGIKVLDKSDQVILTIGLPTGMAEEAAEEVEGEEAEGEKAEAEAAEGESKEEGKKEEDKGKEPVGEKK